MEINVKIDSVAYLALWSEIASDIENALLDLELTEFTIGKTSSPDDRENYYLNQKNYTHFCEIIQGTPDIVNSGEKFLIEYFSKHEGLRKKLGNDRSGGAGNPDATILYIATKNTEHDIDDLDGSILPSKFPIDFNQPNTQQ